MYGQFRPSDPAYSAVRSQPSAPYSYVRRSVVTQSRRIVFCTDKSLLSLKIDCFVNTSPCDLFTLAFGQCKASPVTVRTPCRRFHPHSHHAADQVCDFALFCTLISACCRIRFAYAMYRLPPIASFRPCCYQQRPCNSDCLPPYRGDTCFSQQAGFARFAGQTKEGILFTECPRNHKFFCNSLFGFLFPVLLNLGFLFIYGFFFSGRFLFGSLFAWGLFT